MKLENSINYYYTVLALRLLLERGLISEDEYGKISRYNAEFFKPGREYIWPHWVWTSAPDSGSVRVNGGELGGPSADHSTIPTAKRRTGKGGGLLPGVHRL